MQAHVTCIVNHAILMLKHLLQYHISLLSNNEVAAPEEEEETLRTIPKSEDLLPAKYEHKPFHNTCRKYFRIFRFFR